MIRLRSRNLAGVPGRRVPAARALAFRSPALPLAPQPPQHIAVPLFPPFPRCLQQPLSIGRRAVLPLPPARLRRDRQPWPWPGQRRQSIQMSFLRDARQGRWLRQRGALAR